MVVPGYFTLVAGKILWLLSALLGGCLIYTIFAAFTIRSANPRLKRASATPGCWPRIGPPYRLELNWVALSMWHPVSGSSRCFFSALAQRSVATVLDQHGGDSHLHAGGAPPIHAMDLGFLTPVPHVFLYAALLAWEIAFVAMLRSLLRGLGGRRA